MALMTWSYDITDNVLKNHALSEKIREAAIAETLFMRWAKPEPGFGKKKGESVTIPLISGLTTPADELVETNTIPEEKISIGTTLIAVKEYGKAVPYTSLQEDLLTFDLENRIQSRLRKNMQLSLDVYASTALKGTFYKFIPTTLTGGVFDTDGTPTTQALQNLTVAHLKVIRDELARMQVPPRDDGMYVAALSYKAARGLKNDPEYIEANKYTSNQFLQKGELHPIENIRIFQTNHTLALSDSKGLAGILGEGVVFGDDALSMIEAVTPELRAALPDDYGRKRGVAWYGLLAFGRPWGNSVLAGEVKAFHITSS